MSKNIEIVENALITYQKSDYKEQKRGVHFSIGNETYAVVIGLKTKCSVGGNTLFLTRKGISFVWIKDKSLDLSNTHQMQKDYNTKFQYELDFFNKDIKTKKDRKWIAEVFLVGIQGLD